MLGVILIQQPLHHQQQQHQHQHQMMPIIGNAKFSYYIYYSFCLTWAYPYKLSLFYRKSSMIIALLSIAIPVITRWSSS